MGQAGLGQQWAYKSQLWGRVSSEELRTVKSGATGPVASWPRLSVTWCCLDFWGCPQGQQLQTGLLPDRAGLGGFQPDPGPGHAHAHEGARRPAAWSHCEKRRLSLAVPTPSLHPGLGILALPLCITGARAGPRVSRSIWTLCPASGVTVVCLSAAGQAGWASGQQEPIW